jgi:hypothetical protein
MLAGQGRSIGSPTRQKEDGRAEGLSEGASGQVVSYHGTRSLSDRILFKLISLSSRIGFKI